MKNFILLFIVLMGLAACRADRSLKKGASAAVSPISADAGGAADFLIVPGERIGMVTARSTEAQLRAAYGTDAVKISDLSLSENEQQAGLLIYPDSPNEMEIFLDVAAASGHPHFIRISQDAAEWHTVEGITIGSTLAELHAANGGAFQLNGFGGDLPGLVTSWKGGLYRSNLVVALLPENPGALTPEMMGPARLTSDDPRLKPLDLKVGTIVVLF